MNNDFWNHVARRPRHGGCLAVSLPIELQWGDEENPDTISGRLVDLSRGGIQVAVSLPLESQQPVRVRMRDAEHELNIEVEAVVRWARFNADDNHWHMGLSLAEELDLPVLGELFLNRVLQDEVEDDSLPEPPSQASNL